MIRAFQWDLARQVERTDFLLAQLPRYAAWGYQELHLHLEDAVHYPSLPGIARADAYTHRELETLVTAAGRVGIKVVPIVNLLGHTQYLIKHPDLRDLNEVRAPDGSALERGQICPLHPRTLEIAEKLLRDLAPFCTAGRVHVGLDESFLLGRHPLSQAEIARIGLAGHFAAYVQRLHGLAANLGLRLGLWADLLALLPQAIPLLPRGLAAYDWYYHAFRRHPRMELYNFAEYDLVPALCAQDAGYWGCPMNGAFRHEPLPLFGDRLGNLRAWWDRCRRIGAEGFLVTSWEPGRLALEMTTVMDAAAACLWLDPGLTDHTAMLAKGFERVFGRTGAREAARAALRADEHPFAGYARWEINDRWTGTVPAEGTAFWRREARFFNRMGKLRLPEPFAASAAFRHYLAERDVFVRQAAQGVFRLRRLLSKRASVTYYVTLLGEQAAAFGQMLRAGRKAARRMWVRTRNPQVRGPNELMLDADEARLREWQRWLSACRRKPALAFGATPVCGAWQLQLIVHNFAPALQKAVVEQQESDGRWSEISARFTIDFRTLAARPATRIKRSLAVPVTSPETRLRIAVRGLGQVGISHANLTNGITTLDGGRKMIRLGTPAPRQGFPEIDWTVNQGEFYPAFRG